MQFEYRNFGTARDHGPTILIKLKPKEIQKVAREAVGFGDKPGETNHCQNDT
jgi:hypothetical protein